MFDCFEWPSFDTARSNQHVSSVALYTLLTPFFAADAGTNAEARWPGVLSCMFEDRNFWKITDTSCKPMLCSSFEQNACRCCSHCESKARLKIWLWFPECSSDNAITSRETTYRYISYIYIFKIIRRCIYLHYIYICMYVCMYVSMYILIICIIL